MAESSVTTNGVVVKIIPNGPYASRGKLADAELHFTAGVLDGFKLIGFSIWAGRPRDGRNVTFPLRQYVVNGERHSFAVLRPVSDGQAPEPIRDLILAAYAEQEAAATVAP